MLWSVEHSEHNITSLELEWLLLPSCLRQWQSCSIQCADQPVHLADYGTAQVSNA